MATISTHNGSDVHQAHNRREKRCVEKEKHINPNGRHESWVDEDIAHAYKRLFGDSLKRYNERVREDRKIENYLSHVKKDKKMNPAYEMIIGVYGEEIQNGMARAIMKEFVQEWQNRNPNLILIGAYYHHDEQGENGHVHIDYVPVAHGYKKGLDTQAGLVKALQEQGIEKGHEKTLQIAWEKRENKALEAICNKYEIKVEHPQAGGGVEHSRKEAYIAQKQLEEVKSQLRERNAELVTLDEEIEMKKSLIVELENEIEKKHEKTMEYLEEEKQTLLTLVKDIEEARDNGERFRTSMLERSFETEMEKVRHWGNEEYELEIT